MREDCKHVPPLVRDICECTRAGMTLEQCNRRRLGFDVPPLDSLPGKDAEPVKPMTTTEKIASFAAVTAQTVWRYVVYGEGMLTEAEMQPRLDICLACPKLVDSHCSLCGCACQKENKVKWLNKIAHRSSSCPIGKW